MSGLDSALQDIRICIDAYRDLHAAACDDYWSATDCACGGLARLAKAEAALARLARGAS